MNDELRWAASDRYLLLKDWARENSDESRTERLESFGFKLIRFTNDEVIYQTDKVHEKIKKELYEGT